MSEKKTRNRDKYYPERVQAGLPAGYRERLRRAAIAEETSLPDLFRKYIRRGLESTERTMRNRKAK